MSLNDAVNHLHDGMEHMALSEDSLQGRLAHAYTHDFIHVDPADLPGDLRTEWEDLTRTLTRLQGPPWHDVLHASTAHMTHAEARGAIRRIFSLAERLTVLLIPRA